jgi:hypothetical protein
VPPDLKVKAAVMEAEAEAVTVGDGNIGGGSGGGGSSGDNKDKRNDSNGGGTDNNQQLIESCDGNDNGNCNNDSFNNNNNHDNNGNSNSNGNSNGGSSGGRQWRWVVGGSGNERAGLPISLSTNLHSDAAPGVDN